MNLRDNGMQKCGATLSLYFFVREGSFAQRHKVGVGDGKWREELT